MSYISRHTTEQLHLELLQEEAEQVTLKLQKLWKKYGEAKGDLDGAWSQWAAEKEEMLDSVRMLQQQLTLKDLVIQAFIPQEDVQKVPYNFCLTNGQDTINRYLETLLVLICSGCHSLCSRQGSF